MTAMPPTTTRLSRRVERLGPTIRVRFFAYGHPDSAVDLAPVVRDGKLTGGWKVEVWEWSHNWTTGQRRWVLEATLRGSERAARREFTRVVRAITRGLTAA